MKTLLNSIKVAVTVACTFLSTQSFSQWTEVALPSRSPENEFVVVGDNYFTHQFMGGGIYKSTDNGHNWTRSMKGLRPTLGLRDLINFYDRLFVSTYAEGVYISRDLGESWAIVEDLPEAAYDSFTAHNGELVTVSQNGRVFMSSNAGTRWTEVKGPEAWSYNGENRRVFSNGRDLLFVIGEGRLYKSANNGASWTEVDFERIFHSPGFFFHIATNGSAI
jgi:photosystem II stability/assembly factor-like uncharacterized protein